MVPQRLPAGTAGIALAVALLLLLGDARPVHSISSSSESPPHGVKTQPGSPYNPGSEHREAVVVLGSGRSLPVSSLRRILDALHSTRPVTVRLASGEERVFASGRDYEAHARGEHGAELRGASFVVPAETYPCDLVGDIVETEFAQRTRLVLPGGQRLPYDLNADPVPLAAPPPPQHQQPWAGHDSAALRDGLGGVGVSYPGANPYQHHPLYHRQPAVYDWLTPFAEDVPEDQLQVAIGGTQRLSIKVHDAILDSYTAKRPLEVELVSGKRVPLGAYDKLLAKLLDPRYLGAQVLLADGVRVPMETYRAVVDAHKHKGVYVVDPDDHRMPYADYVRRRQGGKGQAADGDKDHKDNHGDDTKTKR